MNSSPSRFVGIYIWIVLREHTNDEDKNGRNNTKEKKKSWMCLNRLHKKTDNNISQFIFDTHKQN